jgi:iron(III) transport system substrate-binding protein
VVVYTSQDQVYAEPILKAFEAETGVRVRALYDAEAVKTAGLANRLLAEQSHPQCDLFWSNEEFRMRQLAAKGLLAEGWAAVGHRSRRLLVNTNLLGPAEWPRSMVELTNVAWQHRVAMAYPMFGTASAHFLALRDVWGPDRWLRWCQALQANRPYLVDNNSVMVKLVARGEAAVGVSDSDDVLAAQREGLPVVELPLTPELLLIPNSVGVIRGAPHPAEARQLLDYLQRPSVLAQLVAAGALEDGTVPGDRTLAPDWARVVADAETGLAQLKEVFLR